MPIRNALELQRAREDIARLRRRLLSLKHQATALNIHNFDMLAEGPRDEIKKLEAEVDSYLARNKPT